MSTHEIRGLFPARVSCVCGWSWRNNYLRNKSNADLIAEAEFEFQDHVKGMLESGF